MSNANQEYSPNQHYMDRFLKAHTAAKARAEKRRAKELAEQQEQQEIQAVKEKIQQQLLTMADLKAQIDVFKNADNAIANNTDTTNTSIKNANTDALGADEQYKTTIVTKMVALIKQRKMI